MHNRTLCALSINQLEDLFRRSTTDREALSKLHHELTFRSTKKAKMLLTAVKSAMDQDAPSPQKNSKSGSPDARPQFTPSGRGQGENSRAAPAPTRPIESQPINQF